MRTYTRTYIPGATIFFTLDLAERHGNDLLVREVDALRRAFGRTRAQLPFAIEGVVILPDHLHTIWRLPEGDADFSTRWRLIKHA
jgi:putative transposase